MKRFTLFLLLCGGLVTSSQLVAGGLGIASDISVSRPQSGLGGFYLGGSIGNASYDKIDDSDIGFDLFGGLNFNEILSAEFGWISLGKAEKGAQASKVSSKVTALHAAILGNVALQNDLGAFGKLGIAIWDADTTSLGSNSKSDSGTDVFFGFGLDYQIGGSTSVRFGVDFYAIDEEDVTTYAVGIKQKF